MHLTYHDEEANDSDDRPALDFERAIEELAEALHAKMERLDPTLDPDWSEMTDHQREFYRLCVIDLLDNKLVAQIVQS